MREAKTDWYCESCDCCVEVTADESCNSCGNKATHIRYHIAVPVDFVEAVAGIGVMTGTYKTGYVLHNELNEEWILKARDILKILNKT